MSSSTACWTGWAALSSRCGPEPENEFEARLVMNWPQLRVVREAAMAIDSYKRTYRVSQTLPLAALDGELSGSRLDLERPLGQSIWTLAWPIGRPIEQVPGIGAAAGATAGCKVTSECDTGMQAIPRIYPLDIRPAPEAGWSLDSFGCAVACRTVG